MVSSERRQVDEHVNKIIELKNKVFCLVGPLLSLSLSEKIVLARFYDMQFLSGSYNSFVVINQKTIGPPSIDLLAKVGVTKSDLLLHECSISLTFNLVSCLGFQFSSECGS
ncbi:hypothetical protein CFC21_108881 [Triticum aestivum]|uniref:Uncharacterized protein n=3 Tax=Triticinae TaxID=1648030 RepID=A0A9R1MJB5_WHEAT|nr:hypothetical protein CFC21_108879 [Triticum aestivum]KAF7108392.1 hypothetical protein CFC21_108881 [Triticum aestivum]